MKKLFIALAVASSIAVIVRQYSRKVAEADLWAEATDKVTPAP